jgi:hypothetical protein
LACNVSDGWLRRNPASANKKNWFSFLTNWLSRSSLSHGEVSAKGAWRNYGQKDEEWLGPPIHLVRPAPAGPWRAAFTATCCRPADTGWAELHPAIQRELRDVLAAADPLQLSA